LHTLFLLIIHPRPQTYTKK